jgi:hypothetical protein
MQEWWLDPYQDASRDGWISDRNFSVLVYVREVQVNRRKRHLGMDQATIPA